MLLADMGADVLLLDRPEDPHLGLERERWSDVMLRGRRSVTLDLKNPAGLDAFRRLAADADVVVETFRPGVTDRLGIGYEALRARNERLIYCSCPAYPEGHRLADRPGYDALVQASSGQQWEQPGWRPGPIFLHMPMPSMGAMFLVPTGILGALIARETTGRGQHVRAGFGLDPAAVSTVVISHFHPDHVSGLWVKETSEQVFPNAEILMPEVEFKFATDPALVKELEDLRPSLFDADFEPMITAKSPNGALDILQASANNFYHNVTNSFPLGPVPGHNTVHDWETSHPSAFVDKTNVVGDQLNSFSGAEQISSAYAMSTVDAGRLRVALGLRVEGEHLRYDK
jgi:hypothetical protein